MPPGVVCLINEEDWFTGIHDFEGVFQLQLSYSDVLVLFAFYFKFDIRFRVFLWSQKCINYSIDLSADLYT